ncbi:MAG: NHL repeat-containing protein [Nitrospira sp.]
MPRPSQSFWHILFACMTVTAGVPSLSLSQGLTASQPPVEDMTAGGTMMVNVAPELLNALESDAGIGLSEQASKLRTSRVYMVAGTGELGSIGDGGLATRARLWFAAGVAVDAAGNIVIADSFNNRVRRVDAASGKIETVAGTGQQGFSGDGDLATEAQLNSPSGVAIDGKGNIIIADSFNNRIRIVDARTGIISTVAGTGEQGLSGDDGLAVRAQLSGPTGLALSADGTLFIADSGNHRIRRLDRSQQVIVTVAGSGVAGDAGDGGLAVQAELNDPSGVAVDRNGHLLIADTMNNRVRRVDAASGIMSTVAGTGEEGFDGDGDSATLARLMQPSGIAIDAEGAVYLSDTFNNRIRRIDGVSGIITTVVGTDLRGHSINGMLAETAPLNNPMGLTRDSLGNLLVADSGNHCVLRIMP